MTWLPAQKTRFSSVSPTYVPSRYGRDSRFNPNRTVGRSRQALLIMLGVTLSLLGGVGTRLAYLQLVQGTSNQAKADENRIRLIPKLPERGRILDRKGRILAGSRLSHSVYLWPLAKKNQQDWADTLAKLAPVLNKSPEELQKRLEKVGYNAQELVRIARGITPQQVTALTELGLPGVQIDAETSRVYPNKSLAAHVLGYTGEIDDAELERKRQAGYRIGDVVGQTGVELAFESLLRGERGGQQMEVDGQNHIVRDLGMKSARAGQDVTLTLDLDLQAAAEKIITGRKGAIVALDPRNGGVLAMASWPTYDPNVFSQEKIPEKDWQALQSGDYPLINRALQAFPPASTYKIITTVAAIESGKVDPGIVLQTYPSLTVGGTTFGEWNHAGFGPLGFAGAMAHSSDTFFYQVAQQMGGETLIDWTRRFGFGRKSGIELSVEEDPGLVADDAWKRKQQNGLEWLIGDTINMSIGQGFTLASPLQVAVMFGVAANDDGAVVKPHLLKDNEDSKNWRQPLNIRPETRRILHEGLLGVVTYGTGGDVAGPGIPSVAGKSGTAEDLGDGSHTWFGAFAPEEKPEIVVVAFGELSGGSGGSVTGPMVRELLQAYFAIQKGQKPPVSTVGGTGEAGGYVPDAPPGSAPAPNAAASSEAGR
jgi:penicillin-binding protein 2